MTPNTALPPQTTAKKEGMRSPLAGAIDKLNVTHGGGFGENAVVEEA